jgi:general secretion pathway protein J
MAVNSRRGFTLLELLLALAITALVLAAAYTTLFSLSQAQERAAHGMEQRRALRNSLDLLRRELSSVLFRTGDQRFRFMVQDRDFYGKPASIMQYATLAPPSEGVSSDLVRMRYQTVEADTSALVLQRSSQGLFLTDERSGGYPLLDSLEGFLVECHDGSRWVKTWDTTMTATLPKMIRVTVTLQEGDRSVAYQVTATPRIPAP